MGLLTEFLAVNVETKTVITVHSKSPVAAVHLMSILSENGYVQSNLNPVTLTRN